jgi:hypothetical protein
MKTNNNTRIAGWKKDITLSSSECRRLDALSFTEKLRLETVKSIRDKQ